MRAIKPQRLGFLTRPYQARGEHWLGVAVLSHFHLDAPDQLSLEAELWAFLAEHADPRHPVDIGVPKAGAEVLVVGFAHPPGGAATTCPVRVRAGDIDRTLYVIGDRVWDRGVMTEPAPFEAMPLTWARAFGGPGVPDNPEGIGVVAGPDGRVPLPNIESPRHMIQAPSDRPMPAGFGPIDSLWPRRAARVGTYDQAWLETEYPGFASDIDWRYFNLASDEQHAAQAFVGGAPIELTNLHPERAHVASRLPTHRARCLIRRVGGAGLEDVPMLATTLWLFPGALRAVLVHHGATRITEDDARDVEAIVIAADAPDAARPIAHFEDVLAQRTDREDPARALRASLDDAVLLPPGQGSTFGGEVDARAKILEPEQRAQKRRWARAAREVDAAREEVRAMGLEPDEYAPRPMSPSPPPTPSLDESAGVIASSAAKMEGVEARAAQTRVESRAEARREFEAAGLDFEGFEEVGRRETTGPPTFEAERERAPLVELAREHGHDPSFAFLEEMAHGERFAELFAMGQRGARDSYRSGAQYQREIPEPGGPERRARREAFLAHRERGAAFREVDFSGADLSGLDLSGMDLSGAWLESADLSGASLAGARLDDAVLTRATLRETNLVGASMPRTNLGAARIERADLSHADLTDAVLTRTVAHGARFVGARLARVSPMEAELVDCDLTDADLSQAMFVELVARGLRLVRASLVEARFVNVALGAVDLTEARLDRAMFMGVDLDGASFERASLRNAVFVEGTSARGASFAGADLSQANLRGIPLAGARFREARMTSTDVSDADLCGADLEGASARGLVAIRTDLRGARAGGADFKDALFTKADLRGTDLSYASLFGADLALVRGDDATRIEGADQTQVRALPRRREAPRE